MQAFQIKSHVRACVDGASIVFLDLRRDRYWSVPTGGAPTINGVHDATLSGSATRLLALDLIEPARGSHGASMQRARSPAQRLAVPPRVHAQAVDWPDFLMSCVATSRDLSSHRLDRAFQALADGKRRARAAQAGAGAVVALFEQLRPFYPKARVCLFDSIALMRFMLARGVLPTLVLGVRTGPFAAHCWLELDSMLVADRSDHCASFTPIAWV